MKKKYEKNNKKIQIAHDSRVKIFRIVQQRKCKTFRFTDLPALVFRAQVFLLVHFLLLVWGQEPVNLYSGSLTTGVRPLPPLSTKYSHYRFKIVQSK